MNFHVKNVKTFQGMEGPGYNCTLYLGKRRVAHAIDSGDGGDILLRWIDRSKRLPYETEDWEGRPVTVRLYPDELSYRRFCDAQPPRELEGMSLKVDMGWMTSILVDRYEEARQLRRWCKDKTLFRLRGDDPGKWRVLDQKFQPALAVGLAIRHSHDLEEVANERLA